MCRAGRLDCRGHSRQCVCQCQHQCHSVLDQTFWQIIQTTFYNEFPLATNGAGWGQGHPGLTDAVRMHLISPLPNSAEDLWDTPPAKMLIITFISVALFLDSGLKCQTAMSWRHSDTHQPPIKRLFYWPDAWRRVEGPALGDSWILRGHKFIRITGIRLVSPKNGSIMGKK